MQVPDPYIWFWVVLVVLHRKCEELCECNQIYNWQARKFPWRAEGNHVGKELETAYLGTVMFMLPYSKGRINM